MPDIKERPIIFSGEMVRKILAGEKTQTRRVVKPQPTKDADGMWHWKDCQWMDGGLGFPVSGIADHSQCGIAGDRLYVRETGHTYHWDKPRVVYRADYDDGAKPCRVRTQIETYEVGRWTPAIHMPRWASRITLEITNVRIERLQSITEEDAVAEGFEVTGWSPTFNDPDNINGIPTFTPRDNYAEYWDSLNAKRGFSWESNCWVWCIEFRLMALIPERTCRK